MEWIISGIGGWIVGVGQCWCGVGLDGVFMVVIVNVGLSTVFNDIHSFIHRLHR